MRMWAIAAVCSVVAGGALADSVSSSGRMALFQSQLSVLDGRASEQYSTSSRLMPTSPPAPIAVSAPAYNGGYSGEYLTMARSAASKYNVPVDLFLRLVQQESGWNSSAKSSKGAIGLAQLMPATATFLGVDPHNPRQNLEGGARYLRMQYDRFGDWRLALAAYNAGPEAVDRYGDVPPYRETTHYVAVIWGS